VLVIVMGVSGSGKTTVGRLLAQSLGWTFLEADDFHPAANVAKMRSGVPLNDDDRRPWLEAIVRRLDVSRARGESLVLACSALKHAYQALLQGSEPRAVRWVLLTGSKELIRERLLARKGHFMNPSLLESQFEILEPPDGAETVDIALSPDEAVACVRMHLGL
jgi:gluconokinase